MIVKCDVCKQESDRDFVWLDNDTKKICSYCWNRKDIG